MLSLIVPAYNEAHRIVPYLSRIQHYFGQRPRRFEVLVVDDGSTDETAGQVEALRAGFPELRLLRLGSNAGKGAAVRAGMLAARGDLRLMTDADGATAIEEWERLESALMSGANVAIGSRALASRDGRYRVEARWHRSVLGNIFNSMVRRLAVPGIHDTQCGFKLFTKPVAQDLFSVGRIDRYGFDLELLFVAQRRGYRIAEVPINWTDQPGSKVRVMRDGLQMLHELLAIRRYHAEGAYARQGALPVLAGLHEALEPSITP